MILAFETSTNICSVAFQDENGKVYEKRIQGRSIHSDHLFLYTQELMKEHDFSIRDLEAVIVSNGPGSYTGLRIAASAVKGLLFGTEVNLYAANTLASFAAGIEENNGLCIHSILDARRTHFYYQSFFNGKELESDSMPVLIEIDEFEDLIQEKDIIVGTGVNRISDATINKSTKIEEEVISARSLLKLYNLTNFELFCTKVNPEELKPEYISNSQVNNSAI